jgi:hypothetical protein
MAQKLIMIGFPLFDNCDVLKVLPSSVLILTAGNLNVFVADFAVSWENNNDVPKKKIAKNKNIFFIIEGIKKSVTKNNFYSILLTFLLKEFILQ